MHFLLHQGLLRLCVCVSWNSSESKQSVDIHTQEMHCCKHKETRESMQHTDVIRSMMPSCWFCRMCVVGKTIRDGKGKTKQKLHQKCTKYQQTSAGVQFSGKDEEFFNSVPLFRFRIRRNCGQSELFVLHCFEMVCVCFGMGKVLGRRGDDAASNKRPEQL